jgi:hypothetical protein
MALLSIVTQQCKQAVSGFHSNETVVYGRLLISSQSVFGISPSANVRVCLATDSFWLED